MLTDQLTFSEIRAIEDEIRDNIPLEILKRGYNYYRNGFVYNVAFDPVSYIITAHVQGGEVYQVELDLDFYFNSTCSCPYDDYCKHIAATYFYVYSHFETAVFLLNRWKEQLRAPRKTRISKVASKQDFLKAVVNNAPTEDQSISEWMSFFEDSFLRLNESDLYSIYRGIQNHIKKMLAYAEDWQKPYKQLYTLSFYFELLHHIEGLPEHQLWKQYYYFQHMDYQRIAQHCFDTIIESIQATDTDASNPVIDKRLDELAQRLHLKLVTCTSRKYSHWLSIYQQMWSIPLRKQVLIEEEIKRLDHRLEDQGITTEQHEFLQYARAHFHIIMNEDEAARQRIDNLEEFQVQIIFPYLYSMAGWQEWDRLNTWIGWLKPMLSTFDFPELQSVIDLWHRLAEYQQDDSELLETLQNLLPESYYVYSDYLLTSERYKQWVDLQLLQRISPYELDSAILKEIEQNDHPSLLPLYHHAIEREIAEKNRNSYKVAVKLLKKLRAHYKKLKRQDRFENYIDLLIQKYTRLRALHEEMRRGNLLL